LNRDEIKASVSMQDVLLMFGVKISRNGFINCPFHTEKYASMKIYHDSYYCFGCGASGDIFSMTMQLNKCDFRTAFELLGGGKKPSWRAVVTANKIRKAREQAEREAAEKRLKIKSTLSYITAYRNLIEQSEPFSDIWCYCINKLQYQEYLLENLLGLDE
jgi:DNA primase